MMRDCMAMDILGRNCNCTINADCDFVGGINNDIIAMVHK
jgi:hypothetical protein